MDLTFITLMMMTPVIKAPVELMTKIPRHVGADTFDSTMGEANGWLDQLVSGYAIIQTRVRIRSDK